MGEDVSGEVVIRGEESCGMGSRESKASGWDFERMGERMWCRLMSKTQLQTCCLAKIDQTKPETPHNKHQTKKRYATIAASCSLGWLSSHHDYHQEGLLFPQWKGYSVLVP